jgi:Protein of unknown function (DUF2721)
MAAEANPFAALSLIVAPAILTNACSVLIMSTSNRFARTVDRARVLSREIEEEASAAEAVTARRMQELAVVETRSLLLLRAMRSGYRALSGFASAALLSLLGASLLSVGPAMATHGFEALAIASGLAAVGALIHASSLLVRETRLAVEVLQARAAGLRYRSK